MVNREVVDALDCAVIVEVWDESHLAAANFTYVGNVGVHASECYECRVHDAGYGIVERVAIDECPPYVAIGDCACHTSRAVGCKERHLSPRQVVELAQGFDYCGILPYYVICDVCFIHSHNYLSISLTDAVRLNMNVVPPTWG